MNKVKLPEISPSQTWVCSRGCDECTPTEVDMVLQSVYDNWGVLQSQLVTNNFVSDCCKEDILLYDNDSQSFVDFSLVETQEGPTRKVFSVGVLGRSSIHA